MYGTYCRLGVHVLDSNRTVIRAASKKIQKHHRFSRRKREARRVFYREMLEYHTADKKVFQEYSF